ncbi:MAG: HEAT repeat domain-containing protein [Elusimicrobiales bacterium]
MRYLGGILILILPLVFLHSQQTSQNTPQLNSQQTNTSTEVVNAKNDVSLEEKTKETDPMMVRKFINDIVSSRDVTKADRIAKYIYDENKLIKMAAIEGLGMLRAEKYCDDIINILLKETDRDIKHSSMISLSYIPSFNTSRLIEYYNKETDNMLKAQVIRLLASKNEKSLEKEAIKIASSTNYSTEIKIAAVYYLGIIKSTNSVSLLIDLAKSSDKLLKIESIKALGEIGDKTCVDVIRIRAGEKDDDIKIESVLSLAKLGDNSMLESVYDYIDSPNLSYREKVLTAAAIVGDMKTVSFLEKKLKKVNDQNLKSFISFTIERIKSRLSQKK